MVVVEIILPHKIILIGPFPSQKQAFDWFRAILRNYPKETAILATSDDRPDSLRIYLQGATNHELLTPVFELFRHAV
jgi:hypothetical protein